MILHVQKRRWKSAVSCTIMNHSNSGQKLQCFILPYRKLSRQQSSRRHIWSHTRTHNATSCWPPAFDTKFFFRWSTMRKFLEWNCKHRASFSIEPSGRVMFLPSSPKTNWRRTWGRRRISCWSGSSLLDGLRCKFQDWEDRCCCCRGGGTATHTEHLHTGSYMQMCVPKIIQLFKFKITFSTFLALLCSWQKHAAHLRFFFNNIMLIDVLWYDWLSEEINWIGIRLHF